MTRFQLYLLPFLSALLPSAVALDLIHLGLSPNNLNKNEISMGFLPAIGESKSPNTASSLNALLPAPMSVIGYYAQIVHTDPDFSQIEPYVEDLLAQPGDRPVFNLALMPTEGLANVTQDVADRIGAKMADLNSRNITVWLRYAHEANGDWYAWAQQPEAYVESWKMVTNSVRAQANDTYMLWSPNEMYAFDNDTANPIGGYEPYWPGAEFVDISGLSFYHYGGHERLNNWPSEGEALKVISRFDALFGSAQNRSVVLSETGAAYTRDMATNVAAPGNATESDIKWNWLWQLTGPEIAEALPWFRCACWFEVIKDEDASIGTEMKEEDFRVITGNPVVAQGSLNFFHRENTVTDRPVPELAPTSGSNGQTAANADADPESGARSSLATSLAVLWRHF